MEADFRKYSLFRKTVKNRGRITELAIGLSANRLLQIGFDYLLYPSVIFKFGILRGGVVMAGLSGLLALLLIRFYDWSGRDWLGIEAIKGLKTYEGSNIAARMTGWLMKKGDLLFFMVISIRYDPFITMLYMRHGSFNGMNRRDWTIFSASVVVGNVYWTLVCYTGISLVELVWRWVGR